MTALDPNLIDSPEAVAALFRPAGGGYRFARWGRPIAPVVFGLDPASLAVFKGALEAVAQLARHPLAEADPELGANLLMFFCHDWSDLAGVPNLDRLIEGWPDRLARLQAQEANQYRMLRFDAAGAIRAAFVFLRMDSALSGLAAEALALDQAVRILCLWGDGALDSGLLVKAPDGLTLLRPDIAALIRAAYDPVLPDATTDPAHALRLFARLQRGA